MENIFKSIKNELGKYKHSFQTMIGLVSLLTGITSLIASILHSRYNIAILCIGLFFIALGICNKIISSKKESFGLTVNKFSKKQIKISKIVIVCSYALWLFPVYVLIDVFRTPGRDCQFSNKFSLIITSFTNANNDDDFSYKLFTLLGTELENVDTITEIRTNKFINAGNGNYQDSIKQLFNCNCIRRGLLVFGKRSEQSKLFDCSVYINDVSNLNQSITSQNKKIINLQNPDLVNFSIDYQAQTVSEFILGMLYSNANNFTLSINKFHHCLQLVSNDENKKIKSYCALYIGNNLYKQNKFTDAIKEYKSGINYDSTNAYLQFNLATAILRTGDTLEANKYYISANMLNNRLVNPLVVIGGGDRKIKSADLANCLPKTTKRHSINQSNLTQGEKGDTEGNSFEADFTRIKIGNEYGILNNSGDTVVGCQYDFIAEHVYVFKDHTFFIVGRNHSFGALNKMGRLEIPINYQSVENVMSRIQEKVNTQ